MTIINEEMNYRESIRMKESIRMMKSQRSDVEIGKKIGIDEVIKCNKIINNSVKCQI